MGSEEVGARAELEAALHRAKEATKKSDVRFSVNPHTRTAEARLKVSKLERVLEFWKAPVEVEAIKNVLKKVRIAAQDKPIKDLIEECRSFIERAERRVQKLEAERLFESVLLEEGRARFARLEAQAAVSVPLRSPVPVPDLEAEVTCLREELAIALGVTGSGENQPPQRRLREDFVPSTVEEAALWMRCRHQEMEEAVWKGHADVSRLAQVIAEGAAQMSLWTHQQHSCLGSKVS